MRVPNKNHETDEDFCLFLACKIKLIKPFQKEENLGKVAPKIMMKSIFKEVSTCYI